MKKFALLLTIIAIASVNYATAGEPMIFTASDPDIIKNNNRYIPVSQTIQPIGQNYIYNNMTPENNINSNENSYKSNNKKVTTVDNWQIYQVSKLSTIKSDEHKRYIQSAPKYLTYIQSIISDCNYRKIDNSDNNNIKSYKMNLLDGDYAIMNTNLPKTKYIAEYHKDKTLMGLIKVVPVILNDERISAVFYEYRGEDVTSKMQLKHILFLDYEKDKNISQYVYNDNMKLLCSQINNNIYVTKGGRNLIPTWTDKPNKLIKSSEKTTSKKVSENVAGTLYGLSYTPLGIITVPLLLIHHHFDSEAYRGL